MDGLEGRKRKPDITPIDELAKSGHFKENDLPGTDTYDEGMNEKGQIVAYGSTSTESSGNYLEDKGPNDLRYRGGEEDVARVEEGGLTVADPSEIVSGGDLYEGEDAAAKWLRENDPKFKRNGERPNAA